MSATGWFMLIAAFGGGAAQPFADLFEVGRIVCPDGRFEGRQFRYRLFVPKNKATGEYYPLIVWLHGHSNAGENNVNQLAHLDDIVFTHDNLPAYQFFLLAMQCPSDEPYWWEHDGDAEAGDPIDDMIDLTVHTIDRLLGQYTIDPDRISVTGPCSGGEGCWEFTVRYGERLAAAAPLASAGVGSALPERVGTLPIWAFHSSRDMPQALAAERMLVRAINANGGDAKLTEFDTSAHDCWTPAFREKGLLRWLLAQQRGQKPGIWSSSSVVATRASIEAAVAKWTWMQIVLQAAFLALVAATAVAIRRGARQRRS